MKHIKKATALLLASCMTVGMALPVYAAEPSVQKISGGNKLASFSSSEDRAVSEDELTTSDSEWDVIYLVNKARMQNGLEPLSVNAQMQQAADVRKEELLTKFDHTRPNGSNCFTALDEAGVSYTTAGENIAAGQVDATDAMDSWMNSEGHRANILTEEFTHIGVGHYETDQEYRNYWVQLFTGQCTPTSIEIETASKESSLVLPDADSIDEIGLQLKIECEHGTSYMPVIEEMCSPIDMSKKDMPQEVTVSYKGQTATFSVVVKDTYDYEDVKWTWGKDNETATAEVTCKRDGCGHKETAEAKVTSETIKATCEVAGKTVYTAIAELAGETVKDTKEVEIKAPGHDYGEVKWIWSEDNSAATAEMTCKRDGCGHKETAEAKVTSETTAASCEETGKTVYKATAELAGKNVTDTKEVETKALGHDYGEVKWTWGKDNKTATAEATCKRNNCGHKEIVEAKVTSESTAATCEVAGKTIYTATAELAGKTETTTKEVETKALGHNYGEPTWSAWEEKDGQWITVATFTCANDKSHVETPKVKVTSKSTDATCEKAGTVTYSATTEFEGKTYTDKETKTVEGKALGHEYKAEWIWKADKEVGYKATVTAKCVRGDVEYSETVDAKLDETNSRKATYSADGQNVYTAEATVKDKDGNVIDTYKDTRTDVLKQFANPFKDVKSGDWFEKAVLWALDNGITTGKNATTFGTNDICTRGEAVTFLWRAAGRPEVENKAEFTDVSDDAFYADAVAWAADQKITTGMGDRTFRPDQKCSRSDIVTFIWRMQGSPDPESTETKFTDVKSGEYYYNAVLWAVEEGITTGQSETKFAPSNKCTRSEIVTFLYREFNK